MMIRTYDDAEQRAAQIDWSGEKPGGADGADVVAVVSARQDAPRQMGGGGGDEEDDAEVFAEAVFAVEDAWASLPPTILPSLRRVWGEAMADGVLTPDERALLVSQMERSLGFTLSFPEGFDHNAPHPTLDTLLLNVLAASLYSTAYFETGAELLHGGGVDVSGLRLFQQLVGGRDNAGDGERTTIHLGADALTGGANFGRVPYTDDDGRVRNDIYIGSSMDIPGIVHEFGHAVDRAFPFPNDMTLADAMAEALIAVGVPSGIIYTGIFRALRPSST